MERTLDPAIKAAFAKLDKIDEHFRDLLQRAYERGHLNAKQILHIAKAIQEGKIDEVAVRASLEKLDQVKDKLDKDDTLQVVDESEKALSKYSTEQLEKWLAKHDTEEPGIAPVFGQQLLQVRKELSRRRKQSTNENVPLPGEPLSTSSTVGLGRDVGRAIKDALHQIGEELASMKMRNVEEGTFDIYVTYKNGNDDVFSFHVDTQASKLHLQDHSGNTELGSLKIRPSGEVSLNPVQISSSLVQHWGSVQE